MYVYIFASFKSGLQIPFQLPIGDLPIFDCRELDVLADKFARAATKEDRERILFAAESWAKEEGGEGDVYVKIMKASIENGKEGVLKEIKRVDKMMEEKSSNKVKEKLTRKRNVLNSFKVRDEL